ncbi:ABC transporter ATP-binding protein [Cohaesibacter sp. CAU 1516]|nr:ABC transporter ATP-binding protein [Cohaesibacter sp. CAU 1516]
MSPTAQDPVQVPNASTDPTAIPTVAQDLLRIEGMSVDFSLIGGGHFRAVKNASLRVLPGKVTALVGESGSGKSVISQAVMGIAPRTATVKGNVWFDDARYDEPPVDLLTLPKDGAEIRHVRGNRIGMIFQEPMTSFSLMHTIGNQISESLAIHTNLSPMEQIELCHETLAMVGFDNPQRIYEMYPFELSGGMRQRAMIAMALICSPSLLIADEPTTALDVTIQAQILKLLKDLQTKLNMGVLLITHDLGVVANMADEVVVIHRGNIMEMGSVDDIFRNPTHPYLKGLMEAVPHFGMGQGDRLKPLREIPIDKVRGLGNYTKQSDAANGNSAAPQVILSVQGINKSFATRKQSWGLKASGHAPKKAVSDVSFDIFKGECLGLVGESGCGKTTLSKILMRALEPDEGSIHYVDEQGPINISECNGAALQALRSDIQMVFQDPVSSLSPRMTVKNILTEPLDIHQLGNRKDRLDVAENLLSAVGLDRASLNRYPHSFSGGQRQRIGIARALALGPRLVVCDEPVSALDVSVQAQILNLLKDLQSELGLTYLFISHNLAVVNYMADRVAVMCSGRIVEIAPCEALMANPVHPYTRSLLEAVPYPDLDRKLNFDIPMKASSALQDTWPSDFQFDDENALTMIDLGGDHKVLAKRGASIEGAQG